MSSRGKPITQAMRAERKKAAEERHALYATHTRKMKIELCERRPGESRRERARLEKPLS